MGGWGSPGGGSTEGGGGERGPPGPHLHPTPAIIGDTFWDHFEVILGAFGIVSGIVLGGSFWGVILVFFEPF